MIVVSIGCPSGIGPEVSVAAAARLRGAVRVLVGDEGTIREAAELVGVPSQKLRAFEGTVPTRPGLYIAHAGPVLRPADRRPGAPSRRAGQAQLSYIEAAFELVRGHPERALVTGPVSKAAIARSGLARARGFVGHTEWLRDLDGARRAVMCFWSPRIVTSLATTHLPVASVPDALTTEAVCDATTELVRLLSALGVARPRVAVASLNPHAGESELFGAEERRAIAPGIRRARRGSPRARIVGPVGAETAYRKAYAGDFDGVVAMYHDQATIPTKLVAFGDAVNVTMGLSVVRTSVDHGTGYDIAWKGKADARGMKAAVELAERLVASRRRPSRRAR